MANHHWVAEEVAVGRSAPTEATQRELLRAGLQLTEDMCVRGAANPAGFIHSTQHASAQQCASDGVPASTCCAFLLQCLSAFVLECLSAPVPVHPFQAVLSCAGSWGGSRHQLCPVVEMCRCVRGQVLMNSVGYFADAHARLCCLAQAAGAEQGHDDVRWWRRMRLVLLKHWERLDTLLAVHQGCVYACLCVI
eukprot:1141402-Pelagomonas_calceolata.AAC.5